MAIVSDWLIPGYYGKSKNNSVQSALLHLLPKFGAKGIFFFSIVMIVKVFSQSGALRGYYGNQVDILFIFETS